MTQMSKEEALRQALQGLHDDIAEYQRINNLGGYDNHWMKAARAALSAQEQPVAQEGQERCSICLSYNPEWRRAVYLNGVLMQCPDQFHPPKPAQDSVMVPRELTPAVYAAMSLAFGMPYLGWDEFKKCYAELIKDLAPAHPQGRETE